jgi:hypothetical protein
MMKFSILLMFSLFFFAWLYLSFPGTEDLFKNYMYENVLCICGVYQARDAEIGF